MMSAGVVEPPRRHTADTSAAHPLRLRALARYGEDAVRRERGADRSRPLVLGGCR
jgi:hypothetical protein